METIVTRKCSNCKKEKPITDFYLEKRNNRPEYRRYGCKECEKAKRREYRKSKPGRFPTGKSVSNFITQLNRRDRDKVKVQGRLDDSRRRARKVKAGGKITRQEWQELLERCNYTCLRCKRREPDIHLTIDHVIPISIGGLHVIDNVQPLCQSCNSVKYNKTIDYR